MFIPNRAWEMWLVQHQVCQFYSTQQVSRVVLPELAKLHLLPDLASNMDNEGRILSEWSCRISWHVTHILNQGTNHRAVPSAGDGQSNLYCGLNKCKNLCRIKYGGKEKKKINGSQQFTGYGSPFMRSESDDELLYVTSCSTLVLNLSLPSHSLLQLGFICSSLLQSLHCLVPNSRSVFDCLP